MLSVPDIQLIRAFHRLQSESCPAKHTHWNRISSFPGLFKILYCFTLDQGERMGATSGGVTVQQKDSAVVYPMGKELEVLFFLLN